MLEEKEKMISGEMYIASHPQLTAERQRARELCKAFNDSYDYETDHRKKILQKLFNTTGNSISIEPPFHCDYGNNITLGNNVFFNFNCVILDPAPVTIGDNVFFGPTVQIYTATHPINASERRIELEFAQPIRIGSDVWIGGGAIICPGVQIGDGTVIGAGSVVTKDIPPNVVAAGNPCKIIRVIKN
jgi:maltose O-acetyltransferase